MTTSMSEHMDREGGPQVTSTGAPKTSKIGSQAPPSTSSGTAGDGESAPRQFTADEAVMLLTRAVSELHETGRATKAAGVSARMRRMDPAFSMDRTPFSSFRNVIEAAVARNLVSAERGASDFELRPVSSDSSATVPSASTARTTLRPDLWRALLDWTPNVRHGFNRVSKITISVGETLPDDTVLVPSVSRDERVSWMTSFTDEEADLAIKSSLADGLVSEDPAAGFMAAVRTSITLQRRWKRVLRAKILARAEQWAAENTIPQDDIYVASRPSIPGPVAASPSPSPSAGDDGSDDTRERILALLSTLPLHELLKLRIPLEYTLR
jgi:hypothetical protein